MNNNISTTAQVAEQESRTISGMDFVSLKAEARRYYDVPTGKGGSTVRVYIEEPQWLHVRSSGSHTVIDAEGATHYIPSSFVHLAWFNKEGFEPAQF